MTKRSQFILTTTAVMIFIIAFFLDITRFGQDLEDSWKKVSLPNFLFILVIVLSIGFLLNLIIFHRRRYFQRLFLTIPIAFILFSIADIAKTTIGHFGLNEEYNYFSAMRDIKNGKVQMLDVGLSLPTPNVDWVKQQKAEKITANHFGYSAIYLGCTVTDGICIYNSVMENYLELENGKNWRIRERQMRDSILSSTNQN
jgi:hypothetical protein